MKRFSWCALAAALLHATAARAQPRTLTGFDLEQLTLNPSGSDGIVMGSGELLPERTFHGGVALQYEHLPLLMKLPGAVRSE